MRRRVVERREEWWAGKVSFSNSMSPVRKADALMGWLGWVKLEGPETARRLAGLEESSAGRARRWIWMLLSL